MAPWSIRDVPDLTGHTALVTGANSGLGLVTARELARAGASVVMACRDEQRAAAAVAEVGRAVPDGRLSVVPLDLADLDHVAAAARQVRATHDSLDLLVNNAGIMAPPLQRTVQGFELQMGVNHLGHAALTAQLLPLLHAAPSARIVTVSSNAHRYGRIDPDDPDQWRAERSYHRWLAYGRSKLANMLHSAELHRRLTAAGSRVTAVSCHPGYAATHLQATGAARAGEPVRAWAMQLGNRLLATEADDGALVVLRAATDPWVPPGAFVGPTDLFGYRGPPGPARRARLARSRELAARLWAVTEQLTGIPTVI